MKTVKIPESATPWTCIVDGVKYTYPAGVTMQVPDQVAALVEAYNKEMKEPSYWVPTAKVNQDPKSSAPFTIGADEGGVYREDSAGVKKYIDVDLPELTDAQLAVVAEKTQEKVGEEVSQLKEELSKSQETDNININQLQNGGEYRYHLKWNHGGYIGNHAVSESETDGAIIPYPSWDYTEAISVVPGSKLRIVSTATSGKSQNAFYKENGTFVSAMKFSEITEVPETAAFLRISKRNDFNAYVVAYGKSLAEFADGEAFAEMSEKTQANTDMLKQICGNDTITEFEWVEGEYVNTDNATGAFTPYAGWHRTGYIPIKPSDTLRLVTDMESVTQIYNAFYDSNKKYIGKFLVNKYTGENISIPANASYFALSTQASNSIRRKITTLSLENAKDNLGINKLAAKISGGKKQSFEWRGNLAASDDINTGYGYAPKTGIKFGFYGEFSDFDSLTIQLDAYSPNCIILDKTNVTLKSRFSSDVVLPHGVNISGHVMLNAICKTPNDISISVASKGEQNTITGAFSVTAYENFHFINGAAPMTNCIFTFGCAEINAKIWAIGDSYFGATNPARWVYWMYKNGFNKNTLFCGSTGSGANEAEIWIPSLFAQGTPKMLIWAHGMNYASDSTDAPASVWLNETEKVIKKCTDLGVEVILCTIPSVPSKNNEQKNAWVRQSGYRFIDFARAVGADASGTWYTGMLSDDGVHPSEKGAIALFNMAVATIPEFIQ